MMKPTILFCLLFLPFALNAQDGFGSGGGSNGGSSRFDLAFPGGRVSSFVAHLRKASPVHPNVVVHEQAAAAMLPALELKNVTLPGVIEMLAGTQDHVVFKVTRSGDLSIVPSPSLFNNRPKVRTYVVGNILESVELADLLALFSKAMNLSGDSGVTTELQYHEETKTLMGLLTDQQAEILGQLVQQLADDSADQISPRAAARISDELHMALDMATVRLEELTQEKILRLEKDPLEPQTRLEFTIEQVKADREAIATEIRDFKRRMRQQKARR
ncbi:MAG: hypothetical protein AAF514_14445 [Verrucomicrobiota bacterium]